MPENLSPELLALRSETEAFIRDELAPLEAALDPVEDVPRDTARQVVERSQQRGLFGLTQPKAFGGSEARPLALTVVREALAAAHLRVAAYVLGPGPGVLAAVEEPLRSSHLGPLMRGEKRMAFAFTEPDSAPRPTWARRERDQLLVNGCKSYVTGGATADFVCAVVNVEASEENPKGTAMVVIDRENAGVRIDREFESLDGSGHVSMVFEDAPVPISNVIGRIGEGMPRALRNIDHVRLAVAAQAIGAAQWALEFVGQHLKAPHRSGTPLGEREGVRLRYSEARIQAFAARSLLYRTARLVENGEEARNEGAAMKVFVTEAADKIIDTAVQLVGGQALVRGHPLERAYREIRTWRLAEGASDVLRINVARGYLEFGAGRI